MNGTDDSSTRLLQRENTVLLALGSEKYLNAIAI